MGFILNAGTVIRNPYTGKPVENGVKILKRDIEKVFAETGDIIHNEIILNKDNSFEPETFKINVCADNIIINAGDNLGFIYGLLYISEKFLDIKPFWFWMDQKIVQRDKVYISDGIYKSEPFAVKYRGWFFNDEVLLLKWNVNGSAEETWRMAFEALLRCGGNMTIPGTDKTSRANRALADEMGLWITHHHAEPLGAEMFARAYPDENPSFAENEELFCRLWENAVKEQKDYKVVWNLCFRGQGDNPFWSNDKSGKYDTPEKRGALISSLIKRQSDIVKKYVENPVFCTNLYGEIMELYKDGYIDIEPDVIKVRADNGYGRMVTRRRDNHSVRVEAMPERGGGSQGIYYHVSFYDLQAANHITPIPNSVDFINRELNKVIKNDGTDFWVINCSNVRPHTYALDAVRKKWRGEEISDLSHSREFAEDYYSGSRAAAECLAEYPKAMLLYGKEEDEHTGEQFYTENVRIMANRLVSDPHNTAPVSALRWVAGEESFLEQIKRIRCICENGYDGIKAYFEKCVLAVDNSDELFKSTILLYSKIHYYCCLGMINFINAIEEYFAGEYKKAFVLAGDAAVMFDKAEADMRGSEYGIWQGFYYNDCFADIKHSAYMIKKAMGTIREIGDNARHDKWYRETVYPIEDRKVMLLLVLDNHMTDWELYEAMKEKGERIL